MRPLNLILPVAGYGRRFREAGYDREKPLIRIGERSLLDWSLSCLPRPDRTVLVLREDQPGLDVLAEADQALYRLDRNDQHLIHWILLPGPTQGAACSVLAAAVGLPPDEPVLIANCDQFVKWDSAKTLAWAEQKGLDGFILTFPGRGPAWSYAVTNGTDRVVWVVEKKEVSPFATAGVYWWRTAGLLVRSICAMIASGQRTNNEFYMAPAYNFAPLADYDVRIVPVDEFRGLGTPEQVEEFKAALAGGWEP